jgi:N-methylhydantoinase B
MTSRQLDPVSVATIWHSLQMISREMRHIIDRTAQSYLIAELHDVSAGIWTAEGDTVAMPVGLPAQFLGSRFAIEGILKRFGNNLNPGDIIFTNDPYHGGHNNHLPDWGFFRPIFYQDELLFFTMARGHMMDTGGAFPGGYFPNGYDIHAEGICVPPIKIIERGREREDILELIFNNVRWPQEIRMDSYAMIAATKKAEDRLIELLDKYGRKMLLDCVHEMLRKTEAAVRADIRRIPDGTYQGEAATDDDGTELDCPVWVRADVTVAGDELTIDLSRSDAQRAGFVNSIYATTYSQVVGAVILMLDPALADFHNEGTLRPIRVIAPEGLVVNCQYPATVGASPLSIGIQIMESVLQALSKAMPERALAAWGKHRGDYYFAVDPRTNKRYVRTSFDYDGGGGAVWGHDGYPAISNLSTLGAVSRGNVEEDEIRFPWRVLKWKFTPDLTGAGRWRGGPGIHWEALNEGSDGRMATGSTDGDEMQGFGVNGGWPSPQSRTFIHRNGEEIRVKPHRLVEIKKGDKVVKFSSGGGGVGDPFDRDPRAVREDVLNGFVSREQALHVYKVFLDSSSLEIDWSETQALRNMTSAQQRNGT